MTNSEFHEALLRSRGLPTPEMARECRFDSSWNLREGPKAGQPHKNRGTPSGVPQKYDRRCINTEISRMVSYGFL